MHRLHILLWYNVTAIANSSFGTIKPTSAITVATWQTLARCKRGRHVLMFPEMQTSRYSLASRWHALQQIDDLYLQVEGVPAASTQLQCYPHELASLSGLDKGLRLKLNCQVYRCKLTSVAVCSLPQHKALSTLPACCRQQSFHACQMAINTNPAEWAQALSLRCLPGNMYTVL